MQKITEVQKGQLWFPKKIYIHQVFSLYDFLW